MLKRDASSTLEGNSKLYKHLAYNTDQQQKY